MAQDINLNSAAWCDIIFEGKNKEYGAYEMRQTSHKRHIWAFFCMMTFIGLIIVIPQLLSAVNPVKDDALGGYDGPMVVTDVDLNEKMQEETIIEQATRPEVPPLIASVSFTPPIITDDSEVTPENGMTAQEELFNSRAVVDTYTEDTENTEGILRSELTEQHAVTGMPAQTEKPPVDFADFMPQFPGGNTEMMRFLSSNLKYPAAASDVGIEGRVILKFVVSKTGEISNIQILKGIDSSCDKEAVRVVKLMPKWVPGMQSGHPIAVNFTLPVLFKIQR